MRLLLLGAFAVAVFGQPASKTYDCSRAGSRVEIDGRLDDAAWMKASWTDYFVDIEGDLKPKPRFRTRAKMLWDDEYFYIAADIEEPDVWATLTKHDSVIFHDNDFEVFIDPNGDTLEYYEFEVNALNTGWDLFLDKPYSRGGKARNDWEIPVCAPPSTFGARSTIRETAIAAGVWKLHFHGTRLVNSPIGRRRPSPAMSGALTSPASNGSTKLSKASTAKSRKRKKTIGYGHPKAPLTCTSPNGGAEFVSSIRDSRRSNR
jgi:Carbohydrate family 9 binding domain-like